MKFGCKVLLGASCFIIFSLSSATTANNDVSVRFNGGGDNNKVYIGEDNILEFSFTNSIPIKAMALGFSFSSSAGSFGFVQGYGSFPPTNCITNLVMVHGDAIGKFDFTGGVAVNTCRLPDSIQIGGAAFSLPLPVHNVSTLCYSMKLRTKFCQSEAASGFCVDNIFYPPAGT